MDKTTHHVPPSAVAIEEKILGACLLDENAYEQAICSGLTPEDFYERQNRIVFSAIQDLANVGRSHDAITIIQYLTDLEEIERAGGSDRIFRLATGLLPVSAIPSWCGIVIEKSQRRKLIRELISAHEAVYDGETEIDEVLMELETRFDALRRNTESEDTSHDFVKMVRDYIPKRLNPDPETISHPLLTGIPAWDEMIQLKSGELMIIGGRPSMGKTQIALMLMKKQLERYKRVVFFSAEMKAEQIRDRGISSYTNIELNDVMGTHTLEQSKQEVLMNFMTGLEDIYLREGDFTIDDKSGGEITLKYMRDQLHKISRTHGQVNLVVLDYLQLCVGEGEDQNLMRHKLNALTTGLKNIAKEFNLSMVALSQLNRSVESRSNKRPVMSDFAECGAIEQHADYALLLYRDAYYNPDTVTPNRVDVIMAKNRNGPTGTIPLSVDPPTGNYYPV